MAGTGKSTIARTLAHKFAATGDLAASFFFKRGEGDRGSAKRFFPTIANQMVRRRPKLVPAVRATIDQTPGHIGETNEGSIRRPRPAASYINEEQNRLHGPACRGDRCLRRMRER